MKKGILSIAGLFITSLLAAQLPNTDIWLFDLTITKDSVILKNPVNITNRTGYDNQPAFSPDMKYILYTSIRDEKQSDIYKYDLATGQTSQFTQTATSEYSPTFTPDGKNISVVMVEPDSTQRLWQFPITGGTPQLILKNIKEVGYHCWIDKSHVALFQITNPFQLVIADLKTEKPTVIIKDTIGRGMHLLPNGKIVFPYKNFYYTSDIRKTKFEALARKYSSSEDFDLLDEHSYITGNGSELFRGFYNAGDIEGKYYRIAVLSSFGITNISRIVVSPDHKKIAIVSESKIK